MLIGPFRIARPDVVIATSPQLLTAIAGWWLSVVKRAPFIFEVRDLWPESVVTVGALRQGSWLHSALIRIARWLYDKSSLIVTVGAGYRRSLLRIHSLPSSKCVVVANGVDTHEFQFRAEHRRRMRRALGLRQEILVMYLGTHGVSQGLSSVLDAAEQIRPEEGIRFIFVGDGAEKAALVRRAAELELRHVRFLPAQSREETISLYSAADICLAPLRKAELFLDVLPSKLFEIMSVGRPAVVSVDGEARKLVKRSGAGVFCEPENAKELAAVLRSLAADSVIRTYLGRNGRKYVLRHHDRDRLARSYVTLLARHLGLEAESAPATRKVA
jgi:colanic acid biosynthesis glycosyl transferase WcaI